MTDQPFSYHLKLLITWYHHLPPHKRPKCISGTSHHPAAREFHGECHVQKAANSSKVDLAIYPPGDPQRSGKKPAIVKTILRSGFHRKFTTNKSKSINIKSISFDSDPDNRAIILLYTTHLVIHVLLTSKVCFGHIVGASAFPQQ